MIQEFSAKKNWARVTAGFRGGNFFSKPNLAPKMTIVDGWPDTVREAQSQTSLKNPTPADPWNFRRSNGN